MRSFVNIFTFNVLFAKGLRRGRSAAREGAGRLILVRKLYFLLPLLFLWACTSSIRLHFIRSDIAIRESAFARTMSGISGMPLLEGNKIREINTGTETFEELFRLIREAKKSVNIEIYIFEDDDVGRSMADLLAQKASEGVRVNLLVDSVGGREIGSQIPEMLKKSGVEIHFYNPVALTDLSAINYRTHRKLIIVDGKVGMTGGFGFANFWNTMGERPDRARDFQVVVEGPVVAQMQSIFMQNWIEVTGQLLIGDDYFPSLDKKGEMLARMIHSSPFRGSSSVQHVYLFSLNSSREYFWMENSYFIPDRVSLESLTDAAKRGVDVRLILASPDTTDVEATVHAGRNYYTRLLKAGVRICEYNKQILHSKFAVADDRWATVGSANFDNRSFKLNMEANLNIYDRKFSLKLKDIFQEDMKHCTPITLQEFQKRSVWKRFKEWLSGRFEDVL